MAQPFGSDIPRLSWLGGKTYPTHFNSRKNKSGNKELHTAAIIENTERTVVVLENNDKEHGVQTESSPSNS